MEKLRVFLSQCFRQVAFLGLGKFQFYGIVIVLLGFCFVDAFSYNILRPRSKKKLRATFQKYSFFSKCSKAAYGTGGPIRSIIELGNEKKNKFFLSTIRLVDRCYCDFFEFPIDFSTVVIWLAGQP